MNFCLTFEPLKATHSPIKHQWALKLLRLVILFYLCKSCRGIRLTSCWNSGIFKLEYYTAFTSPKIGGKIQDGRNITHKQWQCIFKWKTSMWNKNFGATDDLDRSEYEKTNRHLVGAGNACYRFPYRARSKVFPGRYLQVIGVGISISSIYWWAVRWRKCPKRGKKKRQTNKN